MIRQKQRDRGRAVYNKPAMHHSDLVARMQDRGLLIPDKARAERYVRVIGYYRLSPYMIPFKRHGSDDFRAATSFDDLLNLYFFDRKLRLLVLDALERVEVAIRSALTDHMSLSYGAFWYQEAGHFRDNQRHDRFLKLVREDCRQRLHAKPEQTDGTLVHRSALEHYLLTYGEPDLPPSWIVMELRTLGQLERLVENLKRRSDKTAIATTLGINAPLLESWMRTFVRVRNICAHHGRLWNTVLGVSPRLPTSQAVAWLSNRSAIAESTKRRARLYPVLVALQSLLLSLSPGSTWASRLKALLDEHPNLPLEAMGMPSNWSENPFWVEQMKG